MSSTIRSGEHAFRVDLSWPQLPEGWSFHEVADVAVDSQDRVYVLSRGEHPMMVFDRDGTFLASWGEGLFSRPHGLTIGPDDLLYCVDDGDHTVRKCTAEGEVLMTIGRPGEPAAYHGGDPFNRPTKVALEPGTGAIYVADGYGNARVHKYSPEGELLLSWGSSGTDPGEFNLVHSVCVDRQGRVYVADRENHRIQVFDDQGAYITQWNNMHRPCGLYITNDAEQLVLVGELPPSLPVNIRYPNLGGCVTIHALDGRRLARFGDRFPGDEKPQQFIAPHGFAGDSRGDIYVGEVSYSFFGETQNPLRGARSFRKLIRVA